MLQIFSRSFNTVSCNNTVRKTAFIVIAVSLISGCVFKANQSELNARYVNLKSTPFFPQSDYQCGPAALSTLLVSSGVQVTPNSLVAKVYIPKRKGSLQIEMIAATREYGRVPYLLNPVFSNIVDELHQGRPVLVFQNLGWRIKPVWHYAVVIGYDPDAEELLLRSGTTANKRLSVNKFMRSWQRAGSWAFVALKPGEFPVNVDFNRYFQALTDMSNNASMQFMLELYLITSKQFTDKPIVWFALANSYLELNKYSQAVDAYLHVLTLDSNHIATRNNLAYGLAMLSCHDQALEQAFEAVRLSTLRNQFELESRNTLNQIMKMINERTDSSNSCEMISDPAIVQSGKRVTRPFK